MNSLIGRLQTEKFSTGSAQAELYSTAIDQFIIPFINEEGRKEIVELVEKSYSCQKKANELVAIIRKAVSISFYDSPEQALEYLQFFEKTM